MYSSLYLRIEPSLGDALKLLVLRDGQEETVTYEVGQLKPLVPVMHGLGKSKVL